MKRLKALSDLHFGWLLIVVVMVSLLASSPVQALPQDFLIETVQDGLNSPTDVEFAPNDLVFVAEMAGIVRVIDDGNLLATPFIDISSQCNLSENRGLLGIAVHSDFPAVPYVYMNYAYDPPQTAGLSGRSGVDGDGQRVARLSRVTADINTGYVTAVPGSEVVLVGGRSTWENIANPDAAQEDLSYGWTCYENNTAFGTPVQDCIPADGRSHSTGAVEFGTDGSLFFSVGDASSFVIVDPRSMRSLDLDCLAGKIMRIDPITGQGLPDNPFFDGDPDSNRSKVYNLGLRNPYRFTIDPYTNMPWIGDVGMATWEEVNYGRGQDFGWPCYEGGDGQNLRTNGYKDLEQCAAYYSHNDAAAPVLSWNRSGSGGAAMAGPIYTGDAYPAGFDDARFYADYAQGWIKYQTPDNEVHDFAGGLRALVELELGPDGNIYFIEFLNGALKRFVYDPGSGGQSFSAILRSVNSDKCATVPDGSDIDGRQLVQEDCSGADGQIFDMRPIDGGYNIVVGGNGKCLDIDGAQTSSGAALIQWPCHGGANQVFQLSDQGDGTFEIIADFSGQCVDVSGWASDNGAPLIQWPCHGGANQLWSIERIDTDNQPPVLTPMGSRTDTVGDMILLHPAASDPDGDPLIFSAAGLPPDLQLRPRVGEIGGTLLEPGTYTVTISVSDGRGGSDSTTFQWVVRPADGGPAAVVEVVSVNSDLCVDIYAALTAPGAATIQWPCHSGPNQQFEMRPSGTAYQIAAVHSGLCLQPSAGSIDAGAAIEQAVCDDSAGQRFILRPSGNDYEIVGQSSDLCLDVAGGSITNGAGIIQWSCHGGANQLWRINSLNGSTLR